MVCELASDNKINFNNFLMLLIIIAVTIFKEKYFDNIFMDVTSLLAIILCTQFNNTFGILLGMMAFDFMFKRNIIGMAISGISEIYFMHNLQDFKLLFIVFIIASMLGYTIKNDYEKEKNYKAALDKERRLRYELEQTKTKLLQSSKEISYLTRLRERNRIAREIHDTVGHKATGVLIQLQAAYRIFDKDKDKSKIIIFKCIDALSDTVTILRDTVYNIKPMEKLDVDYIKNIINDFKFCPVKFKFEGDFQKLESDKLETIGTNIKEALTNAAKHSNATEVSVAIDINENYTRLCIKDNGIGCGKIKEGLGISGMKERIENINGTISISSQEGFMIVCVIPNKPYEKNNGGRK
jgi:signal transduction histidine kinase